MSITCRRHDGRCAYRLRAAGVSIADWMISNSHEQPGPLATPCLVWDGPLDDGYGHIRSRGDNVYVHREAWIARHGQPPPETPDVLHHCDVRNCWADGHLWLGTRADNSADMVAKGRGRNAHMAKTHCANGHPFAGANLRIDARGWRKCRACERDRSSERRAHV